MVLIGQIVQNYKGISVVDILRLAKLLSFESFEINPAGVTLENVDQIVPFIDKMKLTYHLPIVGVEGFDFSYEQKSIEIKKTQKLLNEYATDLNLLLAVAHPPQGEGNLSTLIENLNQLELPVIVENIPHYSDQEFKDIYFTMKDQLGAKLKGWLFDLAHSYLRNGSEHYLDILDMLPFEELEEIHLSDCLEGQDSHYAFGAGILPVNDFLSLLKERGYNKIIVNEVDAYPSIWHLVDSYRLVAKYFKKSLYYKVTLKKFILKPIIMQKLKKISQG